MPPRPGQLHPGVLPHVLSGAVAIDLPCGGIGVLVARARPAAPVRLGQLLGLAGADPALDRDVAVWEAELASWQGDLERARSAIRRGLAAADEVEIFDQALEGAWACMNGLSVEADRAEQVHGTALAHDVHVRGRRAKAEAEWTRLQGHSDPARWQAAVEAFSYGHVYAMARCQWRLAEALAGAADREQATAAARSAHATATRLGQRRCGRPWRGWPAAPASTSASTCRRSGRWPVRPHVSWRCCACWSRGAPTARSPSSCSSPARRPACT